MATIRGVKFAERADYRKNGTTVIADACLDVTYIAGGIVRQGEIIQSFHGPFSITSQKGFSVGQKVPIRYNPSDPSEIYLDTSKQL